MEDNVLLAGIIALGNVRRQRLFRFDVVELADELHKLLVVNLAAAVRVRLSPSFFDGWNELIFIQGIEELQVNEDGGDLGLVDLSTPVCVVTIEQFHGALLVEVRSRCSGLKLRRGLLLGGGRIGLDCLGGLRNLLVPVGEVAVVLHI